MREMKEKTSSRKTGKGQAKPKTRGSARLGLMKPRQPGDEGPVSLSRQARQAGKKRRSPGKPRRSAARLPKR